MEMLTVGSDLLLGKTPNLLFFTYLFLDSTVITEFSQYIIKCLNTPLKRLQSMQLGIVQKLTKRRLEKLFLPWALFLIMLHPPPLSM